MGSLATRKRQRLASSDAALIDRARDGDLEAYGQLFERHEASARALARQLAKSAGEADDAVSEAFERVLGAIRRGTGPRDSFRPYLLTTIRRTSYDRTRREQRTGPTADEWILDQGVEDPDPSLAAFEREAMSRAFESLPERWQTVLWHTEVEETPAEELSVILGVRPNALAALAYRAREGLRQAYVLAHVDIDLREPGRDCRWTIDRLPKFIRRRLSDDVATKLDSHLDECHECRGLYFEMADVGVSLRAAMVPLVFGGPSVLAAVKTASVMGAGAGAGVASIAGLGAGGAAAGSGVAAAGTGSMVAGVAAATVAATVGGALVLPTVTTMVTHHARPTPAVAEFEGQTMPGLEEPIVIDAAPRAKPAPVAAETPVAPSPAEAPADNVAMTPESTAGAPPIAEVPGEEPGDEGELGDDLVGDIGSALVITPPVPERHPNEPTEPSGDRDEAKNDRPDEWWVKQPGADRRGDDDAESPEPRKGDEPADSEGPEGADGVGNAEEPLPGDEPADDEGSSAVEGDAPDGSADGEDPEPTDDGGDSGEDESVAAEDPADGSGGVGDSVDSGEDVPTSETGDGSGDAPASDDPGDTGDAGQAGDGSEPDPASDTETPAALEDGDVGALVIVRVIEI